MSDIARQTVITMQFTPNPPSALRIATTTDDNAHAAIKNTSDTCLQTKTIPKPNCTRFSSKSPCRFCCFCCSEQSATSTPYTISRSSLGGSRNLNPCSILNNPYHSRRPSNFQRPANRKIYVAASTQ